MRHSDLFAATLLVLDDGDSLSDGVHAAGHDLDKSASDLGRNHDLMLGEEVVLEDLADAVAADDEVAELLAGVRREHEWLVLVEAVNHDATRHEHRLELVGNSLQRTLNTVEDILQNACPQL